MAMRVNVAMSRGHGKNKYIKARVLQYILSVVFANISEANLLTAHALFRIATEKPDFSWICLHW